METNLTNIMDDRVYLARDYSSIINWFLSKLNTLTQNWTNMSVPQPHTLSLNQIAYVFDILNYMIDKGFWDTNFVETTNIDFINDCFYFTGNKIEDYFNSYIELKVTNNSEENIYINLYDNFIVQTNNSLLTAMESTIIYPHSSSNVKVVWNLPKTIVVKINELTNGGTEFVLPDININRDTINIYYNNKLIKKTDDALFDTSVGYEIIPYGDSRTMFKLSPSFFRSLDNENHLIVRYCINDKKSLSKDSLITLANNQYNHYTIAVIDSYDENITLDDIKKRYYDLMSKISTLYNLKDYNIDELVKGTRIDYISYDSTYETNFLNGSIDYITKILMLSLKSIPTTDLIINYKYLRNDKVYKYSRIFHLTNNTATIKIHDDNLSTIIPNSLSIQFDSTILQDDGKGRLFSIVGKSYINFNYTTTDNNPITTNFINGFVNYNYGIIDLTTSYVLYTPYIINYSYRLPIYVEITPEGSENPSELGWYEKNSQNEYVLSTDASVVVSKTYYTKSLSEDVYNYSEQHYIKDLFLSISLKYPNIINGSVKIINDNIEIEDIGNGTLISYKDDYTCISDRIKKASLIDKNDYFTFTKLIKQPFSIEAYLYYKLMPIDVDKRIKELEQATFDAYSHMESGESLMKLTLIKNIESFDPNIVYVQLITPNDNIGISKEKILNLQSVKFHILKSEL